MYYDANSVIYLDGKWVKATETQTSLYGQTLHYGIGVFEGIRSYEVNGQAEVFKAKEHYERFVKSCELLHIPCEYSINQLIEITYELLQKNNLTEAYIRPLYYMGDAMGLMPTEESHIFMGAWSWGKYFGDNLQRVCSSSYERPNPKSTHVEAKACGHYINSALAAKEARVKGYDEALLNDPRGFVAEASAANFFYEKNGVLYTPPLGNILPGITRQTIIDIAKREKIPVKEEYFEIKAVKNADSAFLTGTAAEVAGIESLDNYIFPLAWEKSLGFRLSALYKREVLKPAMNKSQRA